MTCSNQEKDLTSIQKIVYQNGGQPIKGECEISNFTREVGGNFADQQ